MLGGLAHHPDWLANPILVPKNNKDWRMCVDYTDLNKACKKDPFGLPRIDQIVDSTDGCSLLSFLECYSGYHQNPLKEGDQMKISSSLRLALFVIQQCLSNSKVQGQPTIGVSNGVYTLNLSAMLKRMLMMWL
jgi:hypothetical protein